MNVDFKVDGLRELDKALNRLPLKARGSVIRGALNKAATPIAAEARRLAPRRKEEPENRKYGPLRKSIRKSASTPRGRNNYTAEVKVGPSNRAYYGRFLELGTSKMAARPFLRPAFESKSQEALDIFRREMRERIEKKSR